MDTTFYQPIQIKVNKATIYKETLLFMVLSNRLINASKFSME